MGITLKYFVASFQSILPWSICEEKWNTSCIPSVEIPLITVDSATNQTILVSNATTTMMTPYSNITNILLMNSNSSKRVSSAELYFL